MGCCFGVVNCFVVGFVVGIGCCEWGCGGVGILIYVVCMCEMWW